MLFLAKKTLLALVAFWTVCDIRKGLTVRNENDPPCPKMEKAAVERLKTLGFLQPIMCAMNDFFTLAHGGTPEGKALLKNRVRARHAKRRRAMGIVCLAIDMCLGLLLTLGTHSTTPFATMCETFRQAPGFATAQWSDLQILRVVFRHGMATRAWPEAELRWPMCFYGMLTAALSFAGDLLTPAQRRALRIFFLRSADLSCSFARRVVLGHVYGAGFIYLADSTQPDAPAVAFSHASLLGFTQDMGPGATDLASRLVQIWRGEVAGVEAHALFEPGLHSRAYCLQQVRSWLADSAVDGAPPSPAIQAAPLQPPSQHKTARPADPARSCPSKNAEQASASSAASGSRSLSATSACTMAPTLPRSPSRRPRARALTRRCCWVPTSWSARMRSRPRTRCTGYTCAGAVGVFWQRSTSGPLAPFTAPRAGTA